MIRITPTKTPFLFLHTEGISYLLVGPEEKFTTPRGIVSPVDLSKEEQELITNQALKHFYRDGN